MKSFLGNFYRHLATFIDILQFFSGHTGQQSLCQLFIRPKRHIYIYNWTILGLFFFIFVFSSVDSKSKLYIIFCRWLDSSCKPLEPLEVSNWATTTTRIYLMSPFRSNTNELFAENNDLWTYLFTMMDHKTWYAFDHSVFAPMIHKIKLGYNNVWVVAVAQLV